MKTSYRKAKPKEARSGGVPVSRLQQTPEKSIYSGPLQKDYLLDPKKSNQLKMSLVYSEKAGNYVISLEWFLSRMITENEFLLNVYSLLLNQYSPQFNFCFSGPLGGEEGVEGAMRVPQSSQQALSSHNGPQGPILLFPQRRLLGALFHTSPREDSCQQGREEARTAELKDDIGLLFILSFGSLDFVIPFSGSFYEKASREFQQ